MWWSRVNDLWRYNYRHSNSQRLLIALLLLTLQLSIIFVSRLQLQIQLLNNIRWLSTALSGNKTYYYMFVLNTGIGTSQQYEWSWNSLRYVYLYKGSSKDPGTNHQSSADLILTRIGLENTELLSIVYHNILFSNCLAVNLIYIYIINRVTAALHKLQY